MLGFLDSSVGKESAGSGSIPGLGRSAGKWIGYPLQYSWASLVAQQVKNPPAMQENWVWSLDWEDPWEKGTATHSNLLAWRIPWTVYSPWGHKESETIERLLLSLTYVWGSGTLGSIPRQGVFWNLHESLNNGPVTFTSALRSLGTEIDPFWNHTSYQIRMWFGSSGKNEIE